MAHKKWSDGGNRLVASSTQRPDRPGISPEFPVSHTSRDLLSHHERRHIIVTNPFVNKLDSRAHGDSSHSLDLSATRRDSSIDL